MAPNVAMWARALYRMPRVSREEWAGLDPVARWLIATRAAALVMTLVSAGLGGLWAWREGAFDGALFALAAAGLLLAHATNNLVNDLTDSARGVDAGDYFRNRYASHPLAHGLMTRRQFYAATVVTGLGALGCGLALWAARGGAVPALIGAGAFFVLLYTWPMKGIGLGEAAVLLVWGPLMVGGTYYVVTGRHEWDVAIAALPWALGPTAVLFGKHIDKLDADRDKGIRTLPVLIGERAARAAVLALVAAQYALVALLVARGFFSPAVLVVAGALGAARYLAIAFRRPRPDAPPPKYPPDIWPAWYVALAFHHTRRFGLLYLAGVAADAALRGAA